MNTYPEHQVLAPRHVAAKARALGIRPATNRFAVSFGERERTPRCRPRLWAVWSAIGMLLLCWATYGQEPVADGYRHQIEIGSDNDFLVFQTASDKYYTYGINASYRWVPEKKGLLGKLFPTNIGHFQGLGAHIEAYTPDYRSERRHRETDRPYAGWSYLEYRAVYRFRRSFLHLGLDLGILGPSSQAGDLQNWFHKNVSDDRVLPGWENQLPDRPGANLRAVYAEQLYKNGWMDLYGMARISAGNIFSYLEPRIHLRLGRFNAMGTSAANFNSLLAVRNNREFFAEIGFAVRFTAYNATLQGKNGNGISPISNDEINNAMFNAHGGIYYCIDKWTLGSRYIYSRGEIDNNDNHKYLALTGAFRFR